MSFFMDMETLGTRENSIIISIGTLFIPQYRKIEDQSNWKKIKHEFGKKYYLNVDEQEESYGRTMDISTIRWWLKQDSESLKKQISDSDSMSIDDVFDNIISDLEYCEFFIPSLTNKRPVIWSRGLFESKLWDSIASDLGKESKIAYWMWRDTRTACSIISGSANGNVENIDGLYPHDPLDDCVLDYIRLTKLGIIT